MSTVRTISWDAERKERMNDLLTRQFVSGEMATLARLEGPRGCKIVEHSHPNEEFTWINQGVVQFTVDGREILVRQGEVVIVPANVRHALTVLEDAVFTCFFAPAREDWLRGEDRYLRAQPEAVPV